MRKQLELTARVVHFSQACVSIFVWAYKRRLQEEPNCNEQIVHFSVLKFHKYVILDVLEQLILGQDKVT